VLAANGGGATHSWGAAATSGNATRNLHVGRPNYTSTVVPFVGLIESVSFINKSFPLSWVQRASLDPYNMLLEPDEIYLGGPSVAASTYTLSAATYTNLTSTGVTPRVTVTVA
jgi:hypothetical protein